MALSLLTCCVWKEDVQLPWWGMILAFALAFIVTLPIGIIQATTNQLFVVVLVLLVRSVLLLLLVVYFDHFLLFYVVSRASPFGFVCCFAG
ncbi:hypothetical protein U1Q18_014778 [Sarracenia purpurea var. burkii]